MTKPEIIYFGNEWFGENKTSSHHVALRLSKEYKFIYVECPGLRSPRISGRDFRRIFKKLLNIVAKPRVTTQGFKVYTLFQFPFHKYKLFSLINKFLCKRQVKKICIENNIDLPVLWFLVPHVGFLQKQIEYSKSIYYCTDDYASFPGVKHNKISQLDKELTSSVDLLFVTSNALYKLKENSAKQIIYSPHGVDFEHFNKAENYSDRLPQEIGSISSPIIGFFGLIEHWIDEELIKYLASYNKDWNIVLIGQCSHDKEIFEQHENIYLLGKKKYEALPAYASKFNVGILPYKNNYQIKFCNPLKLKEYLAIGCPVVSVKFPEVSSYSQLVYIAENYQQFADHIDDALSGDTEYKKKERINSVRESTWDHVANKVNKEFKKLFSI